MSIGDGMPVQAMMNGLKFVPSVANTTTTGTGTGTGTGTKSPNTTTTTGSGSVAATSQVSHLLNQPSWQTFKQFALQATVAKSASAEMPGPQLSKPSQLAALIALTVLFII